MKKNNKTKKSRKTTRKKNKVLKPDISSLIVRVIEDNTDELGACLGIYKEDAIKFDDLLTKYVTTVPRHDNGKRSIADVMHELSKHCVHANQLAYISFALGRRVNNETGDVIDLIKKLLSK